MPIDLPALAAESGAMQLGEDGPDGAHWIFNQGQLEAFARLVRSEPLQVLPEPPY